MKEALKEMYQLLLTEPHAPTVCAKLERIARKALAQPEQEPVAFESLLGAIARGWCHEKNANKEMDSDLAIAIAAEVKAIYTTPPQRTWVELTDEQIRQVMRSLGWTGEGPSDIEFARAIEAKSREKNT